MTVSAEQAVAEVACSYDIAYTSFEQSLVSLLERTLRMSTPKAPRASETEESSTPYWKTCASSLLAAFRRASDKDSFKGMFATFFDRHADELLVDIYADDRVNDAFFKSRGEFPAPSRPKRADETNEGAVVYFSLENPKLARACLPIGEIYRECTRIFVAVGDIANEKVRSAPANASRQMLPTLALLDFYCVLYHSISDGVSQERREKLEKIIADLCDAAEYQGPGTGPGAGVSEAPDAGADMFSMFSKMFGQDSEAGKAIGGIGGIAKKLFDKMKEEVPDEGDGSFDPVKLAQGFGKIIQSEDLAGDLRTATEATKRALGGVAIPGITDAPSSS